MQISSHLRLSLLAGLAATVVSALVAASAAAEVQCDAVPSSILQHPVSVCVSLPPSYSASPKRFPTLYFLHGLFENERSWSERGGAQILNDLVTQGDAGEFIVVMPDGGKTFYINSFDGHERYEDFFIKELVPWIDRKFRTVATPATRGISGTSMGGYGALHIAMEHPDVFGSVSAHSAALIPKIPNPLPSEGRWGFYAKVLQAPFGAPLNHDYFDQNNPLTLASRPDRFRQLKLYVDCGESDRYGFEAGAKMLHEKLQAEGFPHQFALRPGDHGWSYLSQYMKYSILFHWQCFSQAAKSSFTAAGGNR
jgi:S-formylglutathione hydrolase FrmB